MKTDKNILRTPEIAFANLPDYPFESHYMEVNGLRMHYLDEGKKESKVLFLFHGQPSWSYLYRHMIPIFVRAGYRVIAPDLIGFGKSDKPTNLAAHSYQAHVDWMSIFVEKLGIKNAAAFMQDWGGMIGLRVLARKPDWLSRLVVANTAMAETKGVAKWLIPSVLKILRFLAGKATVEDLAKKQSYGNWAAYFQHSKVLEIGEIMQILTEKQLTAGEMAAYQAPFPDDRYYAGPRVMPQIVATQADESYQAWQALKEWKHPALTLFSDKDPFLAGQGYDKLFQTNLEGAKGQPHITITDASHFLQEDKSKEIADKIANWLAQTNY